MSRITLNFVVLLGALAESRVPSSASSIRAIHGVPSLIVTIMFQSTNAFLRSIILAEYQFYKYAQTCEKQKKLNLDYLR